VDINQRLGLTHVSIIKPAQRRKTQKQYSYTKTEHERQKKKQKQYGRKKLSNKLLRQNPKP
jgi:hypothetical protein